MQRELVPDPRWPQQFEDERARLEQMLAPWLATRIEHVGSTAVPELPAKPIIDMVAGVHSLEAARGAFSLLEAVGYRWRPHRPEAHLFTREEFALHLTEPDSDLWRERLAFRDALRESAELRAEYAAWKARHFIGMKDRYYDADKLPFVRRVLAERAISVKSDEERLDPRVLTERRRIPKT